LREVTGGATERIGRRTGVAWPYAGALRRPAVGDFLSCWLRLSKSSWCPVRRPEMQIAPPGFESAGGAIDLAPSRQAWR